ncbi:hypothetical protein DYB37_002626, partial [Aphanomyces astaci]
IVTSEGETGIAMLPTKYRKLIWIRRGDFLIVAAAVNYSVEHILYKDQIKQLKKQNLWPDSFNVDEADLEPKAADGDASSALGKLALGGTKETSNDLECDSDPMLFVNRNRAGGQYVEEDDSDDE